MIIDNLKLVVERNKEKNPLYLRNLLKEQLQYYVLSFVYNSIYAERFLFKGGTCLRFCFDLPRLSEDLDFDVEDFENLSFEQFLSDLKNYFEKTLYYSNLEITISGVNKIIYLKFPILESLGFPANPARPTENILHLRIDLARVRGSGFIKELSLKSTYDFSFLIRRYALSDLYAGKLAAIIKREKWEGEEKVARFKGRDFFDIWWLKEKNITRNNKYLSSLTKISSEKEIKKLINTKMQEAVRKKNELKADLLPFFENPLFVENFVNNLESLRF